MPKVIFVIVILALLLFIPTASAESITSNDFTVTWTVKNNDLTFQEYYVTIQNLNPSVARDFNLSLMVSDANFDARISNLELYEWKNVSGLAQWKDATGKTMLKNSLKNKENFGLITIPKFGSKAKVDDFNTTVDVNGTKTFLVRFNTPIIDTGAEYGSSGKIAIWDELSNTEYHPWWNVAWSKRVPILINNTGNAAVLTNYQVNLTVTYAADMNANFSDLRFANDTSGMTIPHWIESSVDSSYANVWFNATSIPASVWTNSTYYLYYGNPSATYDNSLGGTNTFLLFDDATNADINTKWTQYTGSSSYASVGGVQAINLSSATTVLISKEYTTSGSFIVTYKVYETGVISYVGLHQDSTPVTNEKYEAKLDARTSSSETFDVDGAILLNIGNVGNASIWYNAEIIAYPNGQYKYTLGAGSGTTATNTSYTSGKFVLGHLNTGSGAVANLKVRKYASPAPNAIMGSVQTYTLINITSWSNNYTNNANLSISVLFNSNIRFNISTNVLPIPLNYTWIVNGTNQNKNFDNMTYLFNVLGTFSVNLTVYDDVSGTYDYKNWSVDVAQDTSPPITPTISNGTVGVTSIPLSSTSDSTYSYYFWEYKTNISGVWLSWSNTTINSTLVTGLLAGEIYDFRVKVNKTTNGLFSNYSNIITVQTLTENPEYQLILQKLNEIQLEQANIKNEATNAGTMGLIGGLIGGALVIGVLRRKRSN